MTDEAPITAVLVQNRSAVRRLDALGMASDEREIPAFLDGNASSYWIAGIAGFGGGVALLAQDNATVESTRSRKGGASGTAVVAIGGGTLIAIVSPNSATQPAVWVRAALDAVNVSAEGSTGLFKKRPERIKLKYRDDWEMMLAIVSSLDRERGYHQTAKEADLLAALGG
ncbi:MAG TPA: hypothetical protein VGW75_07015 [Solirubrobacteraceae bacterium]|jgi:hypothetical protein|nr:hypothetical protein [Solirubrobacteraceae bacterium]